MQLDSADPS